MNESVKKLGTETPAEKARRLTNSLKGLLKEELAAYGGGDAYMQWVRGHGDGEDDPWVLYGRHALSESDDADKPQGK